MAKTADFEMAIDTLAAKLTWDRLEALGGNQTKVCA